MFQPVEPDALHKLSIATTSSAVFGAVACIVWILILLHRSAVMIDTAMRSASVHRY